MPELPEVETVRRGLEPVLEGAHLTRVRQNRPDLRFPFPDHFAARLEGATVLRLDRRAKYLLFPLSTGETWVTHLGMTGRFTLDGQEVGEFEEDAPFLIGEIGFELPAFLATWRGQVELGHAGPFSQSPRNARTAK